MLILAGARISIPDNIVRLLYKNEKESQRGRGRMISHRYRQAVWSCHFAATPAAPSAFATVVSGVARFPAYDCRMISHRYRKAVWSCHFAATPAAPSAFATVVLYRIYTNFL